MKKYMLFLGAVLLLIMIVLPPATARPPEGNITAVRLYGDAWGEVASATVPSETVLTSSDINMDDQSSLSESEPEESNAIENKLDLVTCIKIGLIKYNLLLY